MRRAEKGFRRPRTVCQTANVTRFIAILLLFMALQAQDYVCPMDPDVRSDKPGVCPRCGMKLVLGIPDPVDYRLEMKVTPAPVQAGAPVTLNFRVLDPRTSAPVTQFQIVHEKLFHMFIVGEGLRFFVHDHPTYDGRGLFRFTTTLPHPGMYRVLGDFYPEGATPQLAPATIIVPGAGAAPEPLPADVAPPGVELVTDPARPIAGLKTLVFLRLKSAEGLQKYLGAWAHVLAASDDLIDMIHTHPFIATGGPEMQFNLIFPRARTYRVWVQFQRNGLVNTAAFNVPVTELK